MKITPRKVNFLTNDTDFDVMFFAALGFSAKLIAQLTGYSPHQVSYRLHVSGVKIKAYREGKTPLSKRLIKEGRYMVTAQVAQDLYKKPKLLGGQNLKVREINKQLDLLIGVK